MARKRLSDLLREETQKPVSSETDAVEANRTGSVADSTSANTKITADESGKTSSTKPVDANPSKLTSAQSTPDNLTELKNALNEAERREDELKKQVAELKADLKSQTASEKKLQTSLDKMEKRNQELETELTEAKQTALQLAEANSQLKQTLDVPQKQEAKSLKPAEQPNSPAPLTQQEMIRRRQERSLAHPVFPTGKPPGQLSEQDLGWVD